MLDVKLGESGSPTRQPSPPDLPYISPSKLWETLFLRMEDFDSGDPDDETQEEAWREQITSFNEEFSASYKTENAIRNYMNWKNKKDI